MMNWKGYINNVLIMVIKHIGDMTRVENWGMTKRHGEDTLVLLDAGWNNETMDMYRRRWISNS